jgi:hypothetical protein
VEYIWRERRNRRGAKDLGEGERDDKMEGQFSGLYPEGQIPSGQPSPLPTTVAGSRVPGGGPPVVGTWRWSEKSGLGFLPGTATMKDKHLGRRCADLCLLLREERGLLT